MTTRTMTPISDPRVSFRARGVWATLERMQQADGMVPSAFGQLREASTREGQHAIRTALGELEKHGYLEKVLERTPQGKLAGANWRLNPEIEVEAGDLRSLEEAA